MRSILATLFVIFVVLAQTFTLQRCANPLPPQGGPRDSIGPIVIAEESSPAFALNYRPEQIVLTFDEWVQLKDPTQILISPPVDPAPKISLKKRSLLIDFQGVALRDSATYVVSIGEAVVDLTESNPPDNLRYVFSTGPVLDSASVSGRIVDAYTGEPIEKALFTLYANLADTAARTENPFYFARTDAEGAFTLSNLRPGTYRGLALENNRGYQLDARTTQRVGFPDSLVVVPDGAITLPDVRVFPPPEPLRIMERDTSRFGLIKLAFDRDASTVDYRSSNFPDSAAYLAHRQKDTLRLFYAHNQRDTLFFGRRGEAFSDTLILLPKPESKAVVRGKPFLYTGPGRKLSPLDSVLLESSRPVGAILDSLIQLYRDTFPKLVTVRPRRLLDRPNAFVLDPRLVGESAYRLRLLPGAITDWTGNPTTDTSEYTFTVAPLTDFGTLNLTFTGLDSTRLYLAKLVNDRTDQTLQTLELDGLTTQTRSLVALPPTTYRIELIEDRNRNRRFDGPDYDRKLQAEPVRIFVLEPLRADWEVEATIGLD